jgi:hypothetical protein
MILNITYWDKTMIFLVKILGRFLVVYWNWNGWEL